MPSPTCASPCGRRDSLVLAWRTAAGRDAQALSAAVGTYVTRGLGGRPRSGGMWALPGGAAAVTTQGDTTVLALAPTLGAADTLAVRAATTPPSGGARR